MYALDHPDEIIDLILRKYQPEKTREQLAYEAKSIRRMIQPDLLDVGLINRHRFDRIANIYRERGRIPAGADLNGFFADDYLLPADAHSVFLHWIMPLAIISMAVLALMFVINQRLQKRVSQKTRDADEAREKMEHYLSILDRHTCVLRVNANLQVQYASAAFCELTGYENTQLLGKLQDTVLMESDNGPRLRQMMETISLGQNWHGEMFLQCMNGEQRVMAVSAEPVLDSEGNFDGYNAIFQDMTQRKNAERLSITDTLTGLYNRNKLDELLYKESKLVNRGSPVFSVILLDIDHFKNVNDEHGHLVGDQVLREFSRTLKSNIRETDQAGRWGGEEFMVICPNTSMMGAEKLSEMLRATMERAEYPEHIHVTSSFGVAEYFPGESIDSLVKRADEGLYWAKNSGRNCVRARPCHVGSA
ncbi:MAG: diguanylate cyclase [Gammaproteobacteria bacterium]|nr:MAG: diguanylate cyclase [Gammaproteobacteria bacterium]